MKFRMHVNGVPGILAIRIHILSWRCECMTNYFYDPYISSEKAQWLFFKELKEFGESKGFRKCKCFQIGGRHVDI